MKINPKAFGVLVVSLFISIISISMITGIWESKMPGVSLNDLQANPKEIKGWMKLEEIIHTYNLDKHELYQAFNIPESESPYQAIKEVTHKYDIETEDIRTWIKNKLGTNTAISTSVTSDSPETLSDLLSSPDDIRGRHTVEEIVGAFNITVSELFEKFNIPNSESPEQAIREIAHKYGFEVTEVREWIKARN